MLAPQSDLSISSAAHGVMRSDAVASNSAVLRQDYAARVPIYPKRVHGKFRLLKWIGMSVMLGLYYGLPWVRWPRGDGLPDQAVLVDLVRERLYFFSIEIWPQEIYYITGLLILASLFLFLVTSLFGRVWCGYACPQTVWTDLFILVERLTEGDRNERIRLDRSSWSAAKLVKKFAKHSIWLLIAAATGGAWIFYFHDAPSLGADLLQGNADATAYLFLAIMTFTTYWLAGHMREQVCTYMCPWPRIQSALVDRETLMVTYRSDRGEVRGPHKKGQSWEGRGHCVDCRQCVAACPMGIDIRDGEQLECINCALCVDACDDVMRRVGLPVGLIAYDTPQNVERRSCGETPRFHIIRPRVILYSALLVLVCVVMLTGFATRSSLDLNVLRDRNPAYVMLADGSVRNAFTVKIMNRGQARRTILLRVAGVERAQFKVVGVGRTQPPFPIDVDRDRLRTVRLLVTISGEHVAAHSIPIVFQIEADGDTQVNESVFLAGDPN